MGTKNESLPKSRKVCTVVGRDFRGQPKTITVQAASVYEAAARAMDQLRNDGGQLLELEVTVHEPVRRWKVSPAKLARWVASYGDQDSAILRDIKRRVHDFLTDNLRR